MTRVSLYRWEKETHRLTPSWVDPIPRSSTKGLPPSNDRYKMPRDNRSLYAIRIMVVQEIPNLLAWVRFLHRVPWSYGVKVTWLIVNQQLRVRFPSRTAPSQVAQGGHGGCKPPAIARGVRFSHLTLHGPIVHWLGCKVFTLAKRVRSSLGLLEQVC